MHEVYSNCLQEGVASAGEGSQGQSKHVNPTASSQQETFGKGTDTLPVCPFKFQIMIFINCSAVSFVVRPFKVQFRSQSFSTVLLSALWYVVSCYALPCHSQLVGIDIVHTHVCSTTTNPSEELALDSGIEHESHCVLPCLPNGAVLCCHELPGSF